MFSQAEVKQVYALTPMQQGLLHHAASVDGSAAYHEQLLLRFVGRLDIAAMRAAWQAVLDRHEALRGRFVYDRVSRPVQVVPWHETLVWRSLPEVVEAEAVLRIDRAQPFALEREHPWRITEFHDPAGQHCLLWSFHHILLDGWSIGLVLDEVLTHYRAGGVAELPPAPSYETFQRWLLSQDADAARHFWRERLAGCEPDALLGGCLLPPEPAGGASPLEYVLRLPATLAVQLTELARSRGAALQHALLAAWAVVAGSLAQRNDLLLPTVVAGRPAELPDSDRLVGLLINTLPLRLRWQATTSWLELLDMAREQSFAALPHQHLPLGEALALAGARIDHVFIVQYADQGRLTGPLTPELALREVAFYEHTPYPLEVVLTPGSEALTLTLRSGDGKVAPHALEALAEAYRLVLEQVARQPGRSVSELTLIDAETRTRLLMRGQGPLWFEPPALAQSGWLDHARHDPARAALQQGGITLSYGELLARVEGLAAALRQRVELNRGDRVAVLCERTPELVVALLAVLQAGAAYVPVDPDFPPQRIEQMLGDSGCRLVLGSETTLAGLAGHWPTLRVDAALSAPPLATTVTPDDPAYVIFTSGSTGRPKGVVVRHRNAAAFFGALGQLFGFAPGRRLLAVTTVSFDIAALELIGALWYGMTVVLADAAQARDPLRLAELIEAQAVDVLQSTPTRFKLLFESGAEAALARLSTVLVGGEALTPALAARLRELPARVFNVYGPTETTIWSSQAELDAGPVHLGRAFPGEQLLVLDQAGRLQLDGTVGELAIAGIGVSAAYLDQPEVSARRFIERPELAAGPIYLTGDLAGWDGAGRLRYLGRRDDQVKIRGVRIEPGEIEAALRRFAELRDAVVGVADLGRGEPELIAYLVPRPGAPAITAEEGRRRLASWLPDALIPSHWLSLDELPQTPNNKLDRRALPLPASIRTERIEASADPTEAAIVAAFAEVLQRPLGVDDDFFALGGHSLLAMRAIGRINRALRASLRLADLYQARDARALARRVAAAPLDAAIAHAPESADHPLSLQQESLWVLDQLVPGYAGYNVPGAYRVDPGLDADRLERAWTALVARHESLRTVFDGSGGTPRQRVLGSMPCQVERQRVEQPGAVPALLSEITTRPFDLAHGPLFRLALIEVGGADPHAVLALVTHHIISDGWSDALLVRDLALAYRGEALPPAPVWRYRDFAHWQRQRVAVWRELDHAGFWRRHLADLPSLSLPLDLPRRPQRQRRGARSDWSAPAVLAERWQAALSGGDRFAAAVAATVAVLHLASGQTDIVLGTPVSGRDRPEWQDQVGLHLNLLPLRLRFTAQTSLAALRESAQHEIETVLAHAEYPFACLVESLGLAAAPGRHPVFDAMLILHQQPLPLPCFDGALTTAYPGQSWSSRFDVDFELWSDPSGLYGFLEYDSGLFEPTSAARLLEHWEAALQALVEEPALSLAELARRLRGDAAPRDTAAILAASLALDEEF
ncbi:amino acid adenylation domain-containing protein [Chitinimonas lacunae]|uniref:Amino acid adenylation domain-containing protein n=1 Tax=Chitinimonas lacunae TaxID=1963018 RepID=A0ABV8MPR6_9NEIS